MVENLASFRVLTVENLKSKFVGCSGDAEYELFGIERSKCILARWRIVEKDYVLEDFFQGCDSALFRAAQSTNHCLNGQPFIPHQAQTLPHVSATPVS